MTTFDAPSRESLQRPPQRTNTPLQALVLMNDKQYVEAARKLAERMMTEGGATPAERLTFAFRLVHRPQTDRAEAAVLLQDLPDPTWPIIKPTSRRSGEVAGGRRSQAQRRSWTPANWPRTRWWRT